MARKIHNPHDRLFSEMMKRPEVAKDFFSLHLPEDIKAEIDLDSLQQQTQVYTDTTGKGIVDSLYSVKLSGEEAYILLLCEHQSTSQRMMPFRLLKYMIRICDDHLARYGEKTYFPVIFPMVFYTGTKKYRHSSDVWQLWTKPELMRKMVTNPYWFIDLMQFPDEKLKTHPKAGLAEYMMKHCKDADIVESLARVPGLLRSNGQDIDYFESILCYTLDQTETEHADELIILFADAVNENQKEKIMTVAEKLREQGREEGWQKGQLEGKLEGELEAKKNIATSLLKKGQDLQFIADITGLSLPEVTELSKAFAHQH